MKRIAVITTNGLFPLFIQSVFDKGQLTFGDVQRLPAPRHQLQEEARKLLPRLVRRGDTVLVDEFSGTLAKDTGAKQVNLGMKGPDDVPVIVKAFGYYQEMKRQHAILLPASNPGAYEIPTTLVNEVHNQKGEISYQVDWENLRAEQYLTLLSVYACSYNDVGSASYFRALMGSILPQRTPTSPLQTIIEHEQRKADEVIGSSMAGQKIDENSWYL